MEYGVEVSVSRKDGVAVVTFESPVLGHSLLYTIGRTIIALDSDAEIRAIVLTGRKNVFITGADLKEVVQLTDRGLAADFLSVPKLIANRIFNSSKVLIAAINGYCLGGGLEVALLCDLRVAVDEVKDWGGRSVPYIGFPEATLGIIPPLGGVHLLAETIGLGRAKELLFKAQPITAARAYEIGLVNALASPDRLLQEAENVARQILRNSPLALGATKHLLHGSPYSLRFEDALSEASEAFASCCASGEKNDRIALLLEERRLQFRKSGEAK